MKPKYYRFLFFVVFRTPHKSTFKLTFKKVHNYPLYWKYGNYFISKKDGSKWVHFQKMSEGKEMLVCVDFSQVCMRRKKDFMELEKKLYDAISISCAIVDGNLSINHWLATRNTKRLRAWQDKITFEDAYFDVHTYDLMGNYVTGYARV